MLRPARTLLSLVARTGPSIWFPGGRRPISVIASRAFLTRPSCIRLPDGRRSISVIASRTLLKLPKQFTSKQLRDAYFLAAKQTHPDAIDDDADSSLSANLFIRCTDAYERLQREVFVDDLVITLDEEEEFRQTCQSWLGVSAETVEEVRDRSADSRRRGAGAVLGLPNLRTRTGKEMPHVS